jgi:hypothetical protein
MGTTTKGVIFHGIMFPDEFDFPWNGDKYDGNIDEWWIYECCGYKGTDEYSERKEFLKENPIPIALAWTYSYEYTCFGIAAIGSIVESSDDVTELNFSEMEINDVERNSVIDFCEKYIKTEDEGDDFPELKTKWYLSGFHG